MVSSLQFADEEKKRKLFSEHYRNYSLIFKNYSSNSNYEYRYNVTDYYIRPSRPSHLDIVIVVWIIG